MADEAEDFSTWLCERLKGLNLDEEVLGEYIGGLLESEDSSDEEKQDALKDILEGMMETPVENLCSGIFMKWKEYENDKAEKKKEHEVSKPNTLVAVMEKQALASKVGNNKSHQSVDVDIKKHVIAQYGQQSDDDISSSSEEEEPVANKTKHVKDVHKDKGVFQNTNASSVFEKEKEKREKQKLENEEKKVKNKQDREKQKEKVEQRKDKEKKRTQKGERRR